MSSPVVDDDWFSVTANLVADRRFDSQLAARCESEAHVVQRTTANPAVLGHARDRGKPMFVVRQTTSRIIGTASMRATARMSFWRSSSSAISPSLLKVRG